MIKTLDEAIVLASKYLEEAQEVANYDLKPIDTTRLPKYYWAGYLDGLEFAKKLQEASA